MRVLFLMFVFPDMNHSFNMYTSLVEQFYKNGHQVHVVAPAISSKYTELRSEKQIEVLRVKTLPIKNVPNFIKGISNIVLPLQFKKAIKKYLPAIKYDLIIMPTPPITLVDLAATLKNKHKSKIYLILRDIFPQNAVDLAFMKENSIIHRYFRGKERKLYQLTDFIGCMSPENIAYILKHNPEIKSEKLHELKNYQFLYKEIKTKTDSDNLRTKYNLEQKFVVVFGGNMGKPQQLENVIELANRCTEYPDVVFFLLGEGIAIRKVENMVVNQNIKNVRIQGTITKQEYQQLISVCDLGLISLHKDYTIPNIPSKTLDYFNVGLPVLASIDTATDYGKVLEDANAGLWSYAGDHTQFKANFDKLYKDKGLREKFGKNGRAYFEKYLTPEIAYQTIINKISNY